MVIETKLQAFSKIKLTFTQRIYNKETEKTYIEAIVDVVPVSCEGKLYRNMPQVIKDMCEKYSEEK